MAFRPPARLSEPKLAENFRVWGERIYYARFPAWPGSAQIVCGPSVTRAHAARRNCRVVVEKLMRNDRRLVDFEFALALNNATGRFLSARIEACNDLTRTGCVGACL
jgi:hypothetical protein